MYNYKKIVLAYLIIVVSVISISILGYFAHSVNLLKFTFERIPRHIGWGNSNNTSSFECSTNKLDLCFFELFFPLFTLFGIIPSIILIIIGFAKNMVKQVLLTVLYGAVLIIYIFIVSLFTDGIVHYIFWVLISSFYILLLAFFIRGKMFLEF